MTTWHNQKIFDQDEVDELGALDLPCEYQVGQEVAIHLFNDDFCVTSLDAIVSGVRITTNHAIHYDLLFKVAEGWYVQVPNFRGSISLRGERMEDSGLVSREFVEDALKSSVLKSKKPKLALVKLTLQT